MKDDGSKLRFYFLFWAAVVYVIAANINKSKVDDECLEAVD